MRAERARRNDYAPAVRPRSARQEGLRRLTPGYLDDLSDTLFHYDADPGGSTAQRVLLTPSSGRRLRVIRVSFVQINSDGPHYAEVYFGHGGDVSASPAKVVDVVKVPDQGEGATRSWGRGTGPVGDRNEALSIRWTVAPSTSHRIVVEYTEER